MKKYAFYISGRSGRLQKFILLAGEERIKSIGLVISDAPIDENLRRVLADKKILFEEFNYENAVGTRKEKNLKLSDFMLERFMEKEIDYMISFGRHLLSGKLLDRYRWHLINFHPSILPMYPGKNAIDQAMDSENTFLIGNTVHFIDSGMDTGTIIMQSVKPLKAFSDSGNYNVILDMQIEMLNKLLYVLDYDLLHIQNNRAFIEAADYTEGHIYPNIQVNI